MFSETQSLLTPELIAQLDRLDILSRKIPSGKPGADSLAARSSRVAALLPIDYRDYSPGDEERHIDWNVYARLDRMVVKLFAEEQDFFIHLLLDESASCDYGQPNKKLYIRQTAAAVAYIALSNFRHVSLTKFAAGIIAQSGALRGRARTADMIHFLSTVAQTPRKKQGDGNTTARPANLSTDFNLSCQQFAQHHPHRGLCIILSDFLFNEGLNEGLNILRSAGHELFCLQILSPQELSPELNADAVELIDSESARTFSLKATPHNLAVYRAKLESLRENLRRQVARRAGRFLSVSTALPIDRLIFTELKFHAILR